MIWYQSKTRAPNFAPWIKHITEADNWLASEFMEYRVRIGNDVFEHHTAEFQELYERERLWQKLKHT